jgi:hypothetical protein
LTLVVLLAFDGARAASSRAPSLLPQTLRSRAARWRPRSRPPRRPPAGRPAEPTGKPFFKTTKGAIALVLLAGSLGYTFYAFSNDRVKSPAK